MIFIRKKAKSILKKSIMWLMHHEFISGETAYSVYKKFDLKGA